MKLDDQAAAYVAGTFAFISCAISSYQMYHHLRNYTHPTFQRYILRLLFMVPVYSLASWMSLSQRHNQLYYDTIRDCYEAWVIYNFLSLCMAYVGGPGNVVVHMEGHSVQPSWKFATCCFPTLPIDGFFLRSCKQGALQFVFIKPTLAVVTLMLEAHGLYGTDEVDWSKGYAYIAIVYNLSYSVALYSLMFFYFGAKDLLQPFNPVIKFVIIKSVVFMTFWQGMALSAMVMLGTIEKSSDARALQNLLICTEMMPAAVLMTFAFPSVDFKTPQGLTSVHHNDLSSSVGHAISLHDVVSDTVHQFAPAYHDYVLYSDGTTGAPRRHRLRTFVKMGQEMTNLWKHDQKPHDPMDNTLLTRGPNSLDTHFVDGHSPLPSPYVLKQVVAETQPQNDGLDPMQSNPLYEAEGTLSPVVAPVIASEDNFASPSAAQIRVQETGEIVSESPEVTSPPTHTSLPEIVGGSVGAQDDKPSAIPLA